MLRFVKNILALTVCLLVIAGSVGVNFYLFTCTHCEWQLLVDKDSHNESCCDDNEKDACCNTTQLSISTDNFAHSQQNYETSFCACNLLIFNVLQNNYKNFPLTLSHWVGNNVASSPPLFVLHCLLRL